MKIKPEKPSTREICEGQEINNKQKQKNTREKCQRMSWPGQVKKQVSSYIKVQEKQTELSLQFSYFSVLPLLKMSKNKDTRASQSD